MRVRWGLILLVVCASLTAASAAHAATTWHVTTTADPVAPVCPSASQCSLRGALASAGEGDTIVVPAGDYKLTQGALQKGLGVSIEGAGASSTTIDGQGATHVFGFSGFGGPITLSGLTITGGVFSGPGPVSGGGGIYVGDTVTSALTLNGVTVTGNKATVTSSTNNGGGGIYDYGGNPLVLINSTVSDNTATVTGSSGSSGGGGIYDDTGSVTLTGSTVTGNKVIQGAGGTPTGTGGGGIYVALHDLTLTSSHVDSNTVTVAGGTGVDAGGGIHAAGMNLTLTGSTVDDNAVTLTANTGVVNGGGGIYQNGANTTITNSAIDGNKASLTGIGLSGGIGLYNDGGCLAVTGSTLADNTGTTVDTGAGGSNGGGAVSDNSGCSATYLNDTLSGNSISITSSGPYNGGGAINGGQATTISDTTIAGNSTNEPGGGILATVDTVTLKNTILADNAATPAGNCAADTVSGFPAGAFASDGNNLDSANSCNMTAPSDQRNANAVLGPLADNGGTLLTQALGPGSAAIGKATCTDAGGKPVTTDERGQPRPDPGDPAGVCDIGAYELQPTASTAPPTISGTAAQGDKLTCSTGSWSNGASSFSYQWKRNGVAIPSATGATYVVQFADEANMLTCTVTASSADGPGSAATSAAVLVGQKSAVTCPKPSGTLRGTKLGPLALGETLKRAEQALTMHSPGPYGFTEFCLYAGFGIRAATPTNKQLKQLKRKQRGALERRLAIALTPNRFYNLDGILPGDSISSVPKRLHLERPFVVGLNTWYFVPGRAATGLLKVRHGEIFEIGIATKRLTSGSRKSQKAFIESFGH